jgi:hypothetical protein
MHNDGLVHRSTDEAAERNLLLVNQVVPDDQALPCNTADDRTRRRVPPHSVAHSTLRVLSGTMGYYREPSGAAIAHVEVD